MVRTFDLVIFYSFNASLLPGKRNDSIVDSLLKAIFVLSDVGLPCVFHQDTMGEAGSFKAVGRAMRLFKKVG